MDPLALSRGFDETSGDLAPEPAIQEDGEWIVLTETRLFEAKGTNWILPPGRYLAADWPELRVALAEERYNEWLTRRMQETAGFIANLHVPTGPFWE